MSLGTILMWIVLVALCVVPAVLISNNTKKKKQFYRQALADLAAKNNCSITQQDYWYKSVIGLDVAQGYLLFVSNATGNMLETCINLDNYQQCRLVETNRFVSESGTSSKVTETIALAFTPRKSDQAAITIEFFNVKTGILTPGIEYQLADKWCKLSNEQIASIAQIG